MHREIYYKSSRSMITTCHGSHKPNTHGFDHTGVLCTCASTRFAATACLV